MQKIQRCTIVTGKYAHELSPIESRGGKVKWYVVRSQARTGVSKTNLPHA